MFHGVTLRTKGCIPYAWRPFGFAAVVPRVAIVAAWFPRTITGAAPGVLLAACAALVPRQWRRTCTGAVIAAHRHHRPWCCTHGRDRRLLFTGNGIRVCVFRRNGGYTPISRIVRPNGLN